MWGRNREKRAGESGTSEVLEVEGVLREKRWRDDNTEVQSGRGVRRTVPIGSVAEFEHKTKRRFESGKARERRSVRR